MRRLYLHIGAHKTGTTALQQGLHYNRVQLAQAGCVLAPGANAAHVHQYLGFAGPNFIPQGFALNDPAGLVARLTAVQGDTIVATGENFSFFFTAQAVQYLADTLRPLFDQIHIVSYLRRQDRHAVSHHQEGARPFRAAEGALWGHAATALPAWELHQDLYLDYNHRMGLWADAFGAESMIIRVYDRASMKNGDILEDFLDVLGVTAIGLQSLGDRNTSLGAAQTKTGHLMNAAGLRGKLAESVLGRIGEEGRLLPARAEAAAYLARYADSNRALNARFNISPVQDLFDDDMSAYPETAQDVWDDAGANTAMRALLSEMTQVHPALEALTADDLRDAARAVAASHPASALRLVEAGLALRPNGPALQKLRADLLGQPSD